jgi:hypothetical protein
MLLQTLLIFQRKIVSAGNCPHRPLQEAIFNNVRQSVSMPGSRTEADPDESL